TEKSDTFFKWATSPATDYDNLSPFLHEIYRLRYDVASAFPNVDGADREGFLKWARSHGVREMGYDPVLADPAADSACKNGSRVVSRCSSVASPVAQPSLNAALCTTEAGSATVEGNGSSDYHLLVARIRSIVESCTQPNVVIAVASKGDDALLA